MSLPIEVFIADPAGPATPVLADPSAALFTLPPVRLGLLVNCQQLYQPGWPAPPHGRKPSSELVSAHDSQRTTITAFAGVSLALIAAGAATLD